MGISDSIDIFEDQVLGSGEHSNVYRGYDNRLDQYVAVKRLLPQYQKEPIYRSRFFDEARFVASLKHDHIAVVRSLDPDAGIVLMEPMEGNLEKLIQKKPLSHERVRAVLYNMLRALRYLHKRNILHASIRPSKILYDEYGVVKLGNFSPVRDNVLPPPGKTTKYLSPEGIGGPKFGDIGPQLDLYCLGFTALELLKGPDFAGLFPILKKDPSLSSTGWLRWHGSEDALPPVGELVPGLPADMAAVIDGLLKKRVADRIPSARQAMEMLRAPGHIPVIDNAKALEETMGEGLHMGSLKDQSDDEGSLPPQVAAVKPPEPPPIAPKVAAPVPPPPPVSATPAGVPAAVVPPAKPVKPKAEIQKPAPKPPKVAAKPATEPKQKSGRGVLLAVFLTVLALAAGGTWFVLNYFPDLLKQQQTVIKVEIVVTPADANVKIGDKIYTPDKDGKIIIDVDDPDREIEMVVLREGYDPQPQKITPGKLDGKPIVINLVLKKDKADTTKVVDGGNKGNENENQPKPIPVVELATDPVAERVTLDGVPLEGVAGKQGTFRLTPEGLEKKVQLKLKKNGFKDITVEKTIGELATDGYKISGHKFEPADPILDPREAKLAAAQRLYDDVQFDNALQAVNALIGEVDKDRDAALWVKSHWLRGQIYAAKKRYKDAEDDFSREVLARAAIGGIDRNDVYVAMAKLHLAQGKFEETIKQIEDYLKPVPGSKAADVLAAAYFQRCVARFAKEDFKQALEDAKKAQQFGFKPRSEVNAYITDCEWALGNTDAAKISLKEALDALEKDKSFAAKAHLELSQASRSLITDGDYEAAAARAMKVASDDTNAPNFRALAILILARCKLAEAERYLSELDNRIVWVDLFTPASRPPMVDETRAINAALSSARNYLTQSESMDSQYATACGREKLYLETLAAHLSTLMKASKDAATTLRVVLKELNSLLEGKLSNEARGMLENLKFIAQWELGIAQVSSGDFAGAKLTLQDFKSMDVKDLTTRQLVSMARVARKTGTPPSAAIAEGEKLARQAVKKAAEEFKNGEGSDGLFDALMELHFVLNERALKQHQPREEFDKAVECFGEAARLAELAHDLALGFKSLYKEEPDSPEKTETLARHDRMAAKMNEFMASLDLKISEVKGYKGVLASKFHKSPYDELYLETFYKGALDIPPRTVPDPSPIEPEPVPPIIEGVPLGSVDATWKYHKGPVTGLAISSDGKYLLSGSEDKALALWNVASGIVARRMPGHTGAIAQEVLLKDDRTVFTIGKDQTLREWDIEKGSEVRTFAAGSGLGSVLDVSSDEKFVLGAIDTTVHVWELKTGEVIRQIKGDANPITCVRFSPDRNLIAVGKSNGSIEVWDRTTYRLLYRTARHEKPITALAFSPYLKLLVSTSADQTARVYNASTGEETAVLKGHDGAVLCTAFSRNGKLLYTGGRDGTLRTWDTETWKETYRFKHPEGEGGAVSAVLPTIGTEVWTGGTSGVIYRWKAPEDLIPADLPPEAPLPPETNAK